MLTPVSSQSLRKRRSFFVLVLVFVIAGIQILTANSPAPQIANTAVLSEVSNTELAQEVLERIEVKGRAPKTGYTRAEFGDGWAEMDGCDTRNRILQSMLENVVLGSDACVVLSGTLNDAYTAKQIQFQRGASTSADVQIDHVVALSDAWQKGAQNLSYENRVTFANDPLNLLAVDGKTNQDKGDSDAASWLPPNKDYRCQYVARQIAVKAKYTLWISDAEKSAMKRILNGCPSQVVPIEEKDGKIS